MDHLHLKAEIETIIAAEGETIAAGGTEARDHRSETGPNLLVTTTVVTVGARTTIILAATIVNNLSLTTIAPVALAYFNHSNLADRHRNRLY